MKKAILLSVLTILLGSSAQAQNRQSKRVNVRQEMQKQRIRQGVASGELTRRETRTLVREQKIIRHTERRMTVDGRLSKRERKVLDRMQDRANRDIVRQKNDPQDQN